MGAVLSSRISRTLKAELTTVINKEMYWTDSEVVLSYLKSEAKRFKVFVANRVQAIKDNSDICSWHHVESKSNPADLATKSCRRDFEKIANTWLNGPDFLWQSEKTWKCKNEHSTDLSENDPEVRKVNVIRYENNGEELLELLERRISSWIKMKRVMAWILRFTKILKSRISKTCFHLSPTIYIEEIEEASDFIMKFAQSKHFSHELSTLKTTQNISLQSRIIKLDPFVDNKGLIRVGGRLQHSQLEYKEKHPVVLPKDAKISELIVRYCHDLVAHAGRGLTINEIRNHGIWICGVTSLTRKVIYFCVRCRYLRGKLSVQKMASLPVERVTEAPPFTFVGVDLFGPFLIKQRRSELKRYGVMFTCFASRAVHISH